MADFIIICIIAVIVIATTVYIIKQKKKGKKCIGCPYSGESSCSCRKKDV